MAKVRVGKNFKYRGVPFKAGTVYELEDDPVGFIDRWFTKLGNGEVLGDDAEDEAEEDPRKAAKPDEARAEEPEADEAEPDEGDEGHEDHADKAARKAGGKAHAEGEGLHVADKDAQPKSPDQAVKFTSHDNVMGGAPISGTATPKSHSKAEGAEADSVGEQDDDGTRPKLKDKSKK